MSAAQHRGRALQRSWVGSLAATALAALWSVAPLSSPAEAQSPTVSIVDFAFTPSSVQATMGPAEPAFQQPHAHVGFVNSGAVQHNVTFDDRQIPSSPDLRPNQSFDAVITMTGTFTYRCSIHPSMEGRITVLPLPSTATTTTTTTTEPPPVVPTTPAPSVTTGASTAPPPTTARTVTTARPAPTSATITTQALAAASATTSPPSTTVSVPPDTSSTVASTTAPPSTTTAPERALESAAAERPEGGSSGAPVLLILLVLLVAAGLALRRFVWPRHGRPADGS